MLAIEIIADKMEYPEEAEKYRRLTPEMCAVTGKETYYPVEATKRILPGLPGHGSLYMDFRIAAILGQGALRKSSWIIDSRGHITYVKGKGIRGIFKDPPAPPWGAYAAPDMRRLGALQAPANTTNNNPVIQFGDKRAMADKLRVIYTVLEEMYFSGFSKGNLLDLEQAHTKPVLNYGVGAWSSFREWAKQHQDTPEWELAVWMLPTQEEMQEMEGGCVNGGIV